MDDKNLKTVKNALIGLFIALLFSVSGLALMTKNHQDELAEKDLKISLLVNEVGTLREDMDKREASFLSLKKGVTTLNNKLQEVTKLTASKDLKISDWKRVSAELTKNQLHLASALSEKENIISDLAKKNSDLKKETALPKYSEDMVDILILGQNAGLMDSMILANINPGTKKVTMISIPRDLYHNGRKINELYSKYGIEELTESVEEITGIHADKYVVFDFNSFVDLIDVLGGVQINVDKSFSDRSYPGPNHSYVTVSFSAGEQHMNGTKALQYARSRKSTSDFDRSKRQQQILLAVKEKIREIGLVSQIDLAINIYGKIQEGIKTDVNLFEGLAYLQKYENFEIVNNNVLSTQNYLYSTKNDRGQYILLPNAGNYSAIKEYAHNLIAG
ncbi:MAG TPA: LCP family protein [Candidatus Gracilibacteria bacterium]|nr:LCP family protein [Candidatus Gracilibacteria bacterium]